MNPLDARTWGRLSAWLALAFAALVVASEVWSLMAEAAFRDLAASALHLALVCIAPSLLVWGAARTLRRQSGGLRLLSAAWGAALGVSLAPFLAFAALPPPDSFHDSYYIVVHPGRWIYALVSAAGLALTVLHKEK